MPALYFVMAVCIPFTWFWLLLGDIEDFSLSLAATSIFISNIYFWLKSGYFAPAAELMPLLHTWSLAVEEQFYILYPLILILIWRFRTRLLVWPLVVIAGASLLLSQWGVHEASEASFYLLPMRAWELLLGAFIAIYLMHSQPLKLRPAVNQSLSTLGLGMIIYAVLAFNDDTPFPGIHALIPTVGAALIILCAKPGTWVGRVLGSKALVSIGLVSYSAYLWHQPLFAFARHRYATTEPGVWLLLLLSLAAFVLAYFSWRFIERPFRNRDVISRRVIFRFALTGSMVFLGLGLYGFFSDGFAAQKLNAQQYGVFQTAAKSPLRAQCDTKGKDYLKPQDACAYRLQRARWAVLGNSHAIELAYALAEQLESFGDGLRHFTFGGCSPSYGRHNESRAGCSSWTEEAVNYIAENEDIEIVVLSYRTHDLASETTLYEVPREFLEMWQSYVDTAKRFVEAGKTVIIILQAPVITEDIEFLIMNEQQNFDFIPGVNRELWEKSSWLVRSRLHELPDQVMIIDPADLFCRDDTCAAVMDNTALYFDNHHMSIKGSGIVSAEIIRRIAESRVFR